MKEITIVFSNNAVRTFKNIEKMGLNFIGENPAAPVTAIDETGVKSSDKVLLLKFEKRFLNIIKLKDTATNATYDRAIPLKDIKYII